MGRNEDFDHPLIDDLFSDFNNISKETGQFIDIATQEAFYWHLLQLKEMVDNLQQDALFFFYIATLSDYEQSFFLQLGVLNTTFAMLVDNTYFEENKKHHKWGNAIFALTLLVRRIVSFRETDYNHSILPVGTLIKLTKIDDTVVEEDKIALVLQDKDTGCGLKLFYTIPDNILIKPGVLQGFDVDTRPDEHRPEYDVCGYIPLDHIVNLIEQSELTAKTKTHLIEKIKEYYV